MPPVLAGQLQGTRSTPVGSPASRKRCQHMHGVCPGNEVHFPTQVVTQVVTCGSGGATVGSAAHTGAAFGCHGVGCVCSGLSTENHISFQDSIEGFGVSFAVNATFRIIHKQDVRCLYTDSVSS
ncbi:unnamed protein product [Rangifer tarandus platyrhynchus]|uniref:Uncharacterized protein n=1 Tax=Rangifer tarandus platyrhynchus TaxID=3082113 RepID=A0AC59ZY87_RANTA